MAKTLKKKEWNCLAHGRISFWGNSWRDCLLTTLLLHISDTPIFFPNILFLNQVLRGLSFNIHINIYNSSRRKGTHRSQSQPAATGGRTQVNCICEHSLGTSGRISSSFMLIVNLPPLTQAHFSIRNFYFWDKVFFFFFYNLLFFWKMKKILLMALEKNGSCRLWSEWF